MKVYNYDRITKTFINEEFADEDPLIPGRWLVPAHATLKAPPKLKKNELAQFNEERDEWCIINITPRYQELRAREYPPIYDIIDGIVKNDQDQINKYIEQCRAVKAKYPKPDEI